MLLVFRCLFEYGEMLLCQSLQLTVNFVTGEMYHIETRPSALYSL